MSPFPMKDVSNAEAVGSLATSKPSNGVIQEEDSVSVINTVKRMRE